MNIKFNNWECRLVRSRYENGRVCLRLQDIATNAFAVMATVNMPHIELAEDEVLIKFDQENSGLLKAMIKAGIVQAPHKLYIIGEIAPKHLAVCQLLVDMQDMPVAFSETPGSKIIAQQPSH